MRRNEWKWLNIMFAEKLPWKHVFIEWWNLNASLILLLSLTYSDNKYSKWQKYSQPSLYTGSICGFNKWQIKNIKKILQKFMKHKTWICHIHNYLHKHLHCTRHYKKSIDSWGLPRWNSCKEPACQSRRCRRHNFDPWARKISWNRKWQPTSVFLPGESYGSYGSPEGPGPCGHKESDVT